MSYIFGDSFDLYATAAGGADMTAGYWDSGNTGSVTFQAGRFTTGQALQWASTNNIITKSSGANDAVHHFVVAIKQTATLSGTTLGHFFELFDGTNAQCSVVFRSDGALLLTSGGPTGTVLATYTGALTAANTWYAFEIEVVVNNTTGSFTVRKNGNPANDFTLGLLNTRAGSTNNYANKLSIGLAGSLSYHQIDDMLWRSDASSVAWVGDIRCYARMPASDTQTVFSRFPTTTTQAPWGTNIYVAPTNTIAVYTPITAAFSGTIGTVNLTMASAFTANAKCSIFSDASGSPGTVLGSGTILANPASGLNAITFSTPATVVKGTQYWIGVIFDTTGGNVVYGSIGSSAKSGTTTYAAFPVANPTITNSVVTPYVVGYVLTYSTNYELVSEPQQDGLTTYVFDANPGDADFYAIAALGSTPASVIAVTTRGYIQKSDAGTRTAAVQLKSGATTVASPTLTLSTSFGWLWRTDVVDPNTSAAWTPTNVNAVQIGPTVVA